MGLLGDADQECQAREVEGRGTDSGEAEEWKGREVGRQREVDTVVCVAAAVVLTTSGLYHT